MKTAARTRENGPSDGAYKRRTREVQRGCAIGSSACFKIIIADTRPLPIGWVSVPAASTGTVTATPHFSLVARRCRIRLRGRRCPQEKSIRHPAGSSARSRFGGGGIGGTEARDLVPAQRILCGRQSAPPGDAGIPSVKPNGVNPRRAYGVDLRSVVGSGSARGDHMCLQRQN
jgi:hypothetical protein